MALPHAFARAARSRAIPANSLFMRVFRASELPALRRREKIHAPFSRFARERGGRHGRKVAGNMRKPANPHLARVCGLFSFSIRCCGCLMALSIFLSQVFSCNLARTRMITAFARLFPARHGVSRFVIYSVKLHPITAGARREAGQSPRRRTVRPAKQGGGKRRAAGASAREARAGGSAARFSAQPR